jgi:NitT/TauT family transport system substrate-binding protein
MRKLPMALFATLTSALVAWAWPIAQAQPKRVPIRVAAIPIANFTPLLVARDQGWFAEEGLAVTWTMVAQGALAVEAVYGGSAEFGCSAILEPMVARGNRLDVMLAVPNTRIRSAPPDNSGVVVRDKDPIKSAKDLVGKRIAAGLINSVNYLHIQEWMQKQGADPKTSQFMEIPFPQMPDALFQNRVDAVWAVEPFLTIMMKTGNARTIAYPYQENIPNMDIALLIAKESWLKANADAARKFRRAMDRATTHLAETAKAERDDWVAKFTGVKPELVAEVNLPQFTTEFNIPSLQANLDLAVRRGAVKPFDVETMMWKP